MAHDPSGELSISRQAWGLKRALEAAQKEPQEAASRASLAELAEQCEALCRNVEQLERDHRGQWLRETLPAEPLGTTDREDTAPHEAPDRSHRSADGIPARDDSALRRENETALARAHLALKRKNNEMREFLSIVAHDLKHPVMGIDWMLGLLDRQARHRLQPRDRQNLEMAMSECGRIRQMLDELGHHVRIARSDPPSERVDLGQLLESCAERFRGMARKAGAELHVDAPSLELRLARSFVEQMVLNLLDNALKYGCGEGEGEGEGKGNNRIELTGRCDRAECRIAVTDHGPGIPPRHREQIFHPFRRLYGGGRKSGSGLGLPAVRRLAETLDGRVELDSEPGHGTRFTIRLPLNDPGPEPEPDHDHDPEPG